MEDYKNKVDEVTLRISEFRNSSFPAKLVVRGIYLSSYSEPYHENCVIDIDLFQYVDKIYKGSIIRMLGYSVTRGFEKRKKANMTKLPFDDILADLTSSARKDGGFNIFSDGRNGSIDNERRIRCYRATKYKSGFVVKDNRSDAYRKDSIINDRSNNRRKGLKDCRRSKTQRSDCKEGKCKVFFVVGYDEKSFYIKCGYGNRTHTNHVFHKYNDESTAPIKLMKETQQTVVKLCDKAHTRSSTTTDIVNSCDNLRFTRSQVTYIKRLNKQVRDAEGCVSSNTDTDDLIEFLESLEECRYTILYNEPESVGNTSSDILINEVYDSDHQDNPYHSSVEYSKEENNSIRNFCITQRNGIGCKGSSKMVIGTAWSLKHLRRFAKSYGQIIYIDATEGTNEEERPLLTISTRTGMNKIVTIFRAALPNNQKWVYKWITQNAIPDLLGKQFCNDVKVILTDGDTQEYEMIDSSMRTLFKNAKRVRCGWHIVDRGWKRHLDKVVKAQDVRYTYQMGVIISTCKYWMYSWMRRSTLTLREFQISCAIFEDYLKSPTVLRVIGVRSSNHILEFVRRNVLSHDHHFVFYQRKNIFHLESYSNTAHEGTFNALKYNSTAALPCHSLLQSHKVQIYQDTKKFVQMEKEAVDEFCKKKMWLTNDVSEYLTTPAVSLLSSIVDQVENYASFRVTSTSFHVKRSSKLSGDSLIPRFHRVYVVSINNNVMSCSCGYHEVNGIPCSHIAHVLSKQFNGWIGFSPYDVSTFWWSVNYYCCTQSPHETSTKNLQSSLEKLKGMDSPGVCISNNISLIDDNVYCYGDKSLPAYQTTVPPSDIVCIPSDAMEYCVNYKQEKIAHILSKYEHSTMGLTQVSHVDSSSEDNDCDSIMSFDVEDDVCNFHERQISFEEHHKSSIITDDKAYCTLKSDFATLCKLIDGDVEQIKRWKEILNKGIGEATSNLNITSSDSTSDDNYVSCYKGNGEIKKRKRKRMKTKDYV